MKRHGINMYYLHYDKGINLGRLWLSSLGYLVYLPPNTLSYQSFDYEHHLMKVIPETD
jgi:hypothetical protein